MNAQSPVVSEVMLPVEEPSDVELVLDVVVVLNVVGAIEVSLTEADELVVPVDVVVDSEDTPTFSNAHADAPMQTTAMMTCLLIGPSPQIK